MPNLHLHLHALLVAATAPEAPAGTPIDPPPVAPPAHSATEWASDIWKRLSDPEMLGRIVAVVVTLVLAVVVYTALRRGIDHLLKRNQQVRFLGIRLLRWIYIPLVFLVLLQQLGVHLGSLWTVVSTTLAMIAIGFVAVWSMLSNVSATFMIFTTRMFGVGDEIEVLEPTAKSGLRGKVIDMNLLYTAIEHESVDGKGRIVTKVPNNIFFQKALRIRYDGAELPEEEDEDDESEAKPVDDGRDVPPEVAQPKPR